MTEKETCEIVCELQATSVTWQDFFWKFQVETAQIWAAQTNRQPSLPPKLALDWAAITNYHTVHVSLRKCLLSCKSCCSFLFFCLRIHKGASQNDWTVVILDLDFFLHFPKMIPTLFLSASYFTFYWDLSFNWKWPEICRLSHSAALSQILPFCE